MNRYISSFVATAMLYVTLMATFLYSYDEPKVLQSKNKQSDQNVKFTIVSQKVVEPEKIVKKIEAKKLIEPKKIKPKKITKKIEPKKIVKKIKSNKIIKKIEPKKIVKKVKPKEIKPKKVVKKIKKKEIFKQNQKAQIKKTIVKDTTTENIEKNKQKEIYKKKYFEKLKQTISKNKSYPKTAIRRNIEGDVKISLTVSPNGELLDFKIIEGHRIFKKSIKKAMQKSFPFKPKKDVFLSNLDLSLTISYKLF